MGNGNGIDIENRRTVVRAGRQVWIDQARWLAIVLVLIGHGVGQLRPHSGLAIAISNFVYMFHIPVLVILAGWGARRSQANAEGLTKTFWQLLVPYILFQLIAFGVNWLVESDSPSWTFTSQTFGLWFLVALAGWRLLGPWFRGFRYPTAVALAVSLIAGLSSDIDGFLSLSRIAFFLPMFILGPSLVESISVWRRRALARALGVAALATAAAWVLWQGTEFARSPYFGRASYPSLHQGIVEGGICRILTLGVSTVLAASFMLALPGGRGNDNLVGRWAAQAGQHSMYPYLVHLPLLTVLGATGWQSAVGSVSGPIIAVASATVLASLAVTPLARSALQILVEPRNLWR